MFFFIQKYKIDCRITIELLDTESDEAEKPVNKVKSWNKYVDRLTNPAASGSNNTTSTAVANASNNAATTIATNANANAGDGNGTDIKSERSDEDAVVSK